MKELDGGFAVITGGAKRVEGVRRVLAVWTALLLLAGVVAVAQPDNPEATASLPVGPAEADESSVGATAVQDSVAADATTAADVGDMPLSSEAGKGDGGGQAVRAGAGTPGRPATGSAESVPAGPLPAGPGTHGVTDTTIEVGAREADLTAAYAATSAATGCTESCEQYSTASQREAILAAVDAVNSIGGIAGRRVVPVIYHSDGTTFATPSGRQREEAEACALFTEDHRVFAFGGNPGTGGMVECAAKSKTPWIPTIYHLRLAEQRARSVWDYYYEPADPLADRANRGMARFFLDHGVFGRGAKVGLMVEDQPDQVQAAQAMKPVLAAAGLAPAVEIHYPDPIESPWSTYVLQLQSAGVTNVLWAVQSSQVIPPVLMMRAAESQNYRPRWGFGSDMTLGALPDFNAPPEQLTNVLAMGWRPGADTLDVSSQSVNADAAGVCDAAAKKRGQDTNGLGFVRAQCEWLFFLRAALSRAEELSPAGLADGVAALGETYGSLLTVGGRTSFVNRHDGVTSVRPVAYDRASNSFQYAGGPEPLRG